MKNLTFHIYILLLFLLVNVMNSSQKIFLEFLKEHKKQIDYFNTTDYSVDYDVKIE